MVKSKHIIIACVVVVIGIVAYFIFSQSEAEKVKMQFEFIAEKINKDSGENPIIAAANANKIKEVFTEPFTVQAPAFDVFREASTDDISPFILAMRARYSEIALKFYDYVIEFPSKKTANASVTQRMRAKLTAGENVEDINELSCQLIKVDDIWLITEIEIVAVLEK
jgi:hypothetical protein